MEGECPDQVRSRRNSEEISGSCVCGPHEGQGFPDLRRQHAGRTGGYLTEYESLLLGCASVRVRASQWLAS